jgi:ABC-2 type transport system permease protein
MTIIMHQINAILTIATRDFTKLLRDRPRIASSFVFPVIFIGVLGGSLAANIDPGYNFLHFVFIGVLGQTLFQSTAAGIISLVEDRENDFSQEIFVSPISRYTIIIGKIVGETLVSFTQALGIVIFGILIGVPLPVAMLIKLIPFGFLAAMLGGSFGVIVMANLSGQRSANQIFPFLIFPQFFLAGVFNPIQNLPPYLLIPSRLAPMTYAVDLMRAVYYSGTGLSDKTTLYSIWTNLAVMAVVFSLFLFVGTYIFVRNERNK